MNKKTSVIIIIVVLVIAVIGGGFWYGKSKKNQFMESKQVKSNDQNQSEFNNDKQNQDSNETEMVWYEIPELKIRFKVDKIVADDLIYKYEKINNNLESISFSSNGLSAISGCGVENGPLGSFDKLKGKPSDYNDNVYYTSRNPKQYDKFFIIYNGPQSVCAVKDNMKNWEEYFAKNPKFREWINPAFKTVEVVD